MNGSNNQFFNTGVNSTANILNNRPYNYNSAPVLNQNSSSNNILLNNNPLQIGYNNPNSTSNNVFNNNNNLNTANLQGIGSSNNNNNILTSGVFGGVNNNIFNNNNLRNNNFQNSSNTSNSLGLGIPNNSNQSNNFNQNNINTNYIDVCRNEILQKFQMIFSAMLSESPYCEFKFFIPKQYPQNVQQNEFLQHYVSENLKKTEDGEVNFLDKNLFNYYFKQLNEKKLSLMYFPSPVNSIFQLNKIIKKTYLLTLKSIVTVQNTEKNFKRCNEAIRAFNKSKQLFEQSRKQFSLNLLQIGGLVDKVLIANNCCELNLNKIELLKKETISLTNSIYDSSESVVKLVNFANNHDWDEQEKLEEQQEDRTRIKEEYLIDISQSIKKIKEKSSILYEQSAYNIGLMSFIVNDLKDIVEYGTIKSVVTFN